jgi:hypothetical protein
MIQLTALFVAGVMTLLTWATLNAVILWWRARKLNAWAIRFRDAYVISLKGGLGLLITAYGLTSLGTTLFLWTAGIAFESGFAPEVITLGDKFNTNSLFRTYGYFFAYGIGLAVSWFIQAHYLQKLQKTAPVISKKEARKISTSTLLYYLLITICPSLVIYGIQWMKTAIS